MAKIHVELNEKEVRNMMRSSEMMAICREYAAGIASEAGAGYGVSTYVGKTRVNASAYAETEKAHRDNLKNNTLLKALGGG